MSTIRPLFTITVLVVVGAYLYVKINEGPKHPSSDAHAGTQDGVPPLAAAAGGATLAQDSAAPAWPPADAKSAPTATPGLNGAAAAAPAVPAAASNEDATKGGVPEVPPIPELPEFPKSVGAA